MKNRPILMNAFSVHAILAGRKTQTRRVVKTIAGFNKLLDEANQKIYDVQEWLNMSGNPDFLLHACPYGQRGDRLWVRETFTIPGYNGWKVSEIIEVNRHPFIHYKTCDEWTDRKLKIGQPICWRPSIFMPRWASRITLEIVNVRVEQLQQISKTDIWAEGVNPMIELTDGDLVITRDQLLPHWIRLWNSINASKGFGWDVNPWVWVVEFKLIS